MTTERYSVAGKFTVRLESLVAEEGISESYDVEVLTEVSAILVHMASVPTNSENFTIAIDSVSGSANDTVLKAYNFASGSAADLVHQPTEGLFLSPGDKLTLEFANSGSVVTGAKIVLKEYL